MDSESSAVMKKSRDMLIAVVSQYTLTVQELRVCNFESIYCMSFEEGRERHQKQIGSMEKERHRGVVKFFRGSFGWLTAATCSDAVGDRDIFLHKNQLNSVP